MKLKGTEVRSKSQVLPARLHIEFLVLIRSKLFVNFQRDRIRHIYDFASEIIEYRGSEKVNELSS